MSYGPYEERAEVYLMQLLQKVKDFQFYTENGVKGNEGGRGNKATIS